MKVYIMVELHKIHINTNHVINLLNYSNIIFLSK